MVICYSPQGVRTVPHDLPCIKFVKKSLFFLFRSQTRFKQLQFDRVSLRNPPSGRMRLARCQNLPPQFRQQRYRKKHFTSYMRQEPTGVGELRYHPRHSHDFTTQFDFERVMVKLLDPRRFATGICQLRRYPLRFNEQPIKWRSRRSFRAENPLCQS